MSQKAYLKDKDFLKELDLLSLKEQFVKITLLDFQENEIQQIEGKVSAGSINIDGKSSLRRTGNLTFVPNEKEGNITDINNLISINKKIKLEIGYRNTLTKYTGEEIIWFPLGIYVITDASMSSSLSGSSISLTLQDKMCLLNGFCGGTIPAMITLHEDADNQPVLIYNIIQEAVSHLGGEELGRIIINDVEIRAKQLLRWNGQEDTILCEEENGALTLNTLAESQNKLALQVFSPGENVGYAFTDFTFPGELIADAGSSVVTILDKIKEVLGNYEYFYDLDGNFIFQEIKNYLNTSRSTVEIQRMQNEDYIPDHSANGGFIYNFDSSELITSIGNSPQYGMIKNNFIVWGIRTSAAGVTLPIRYHLAFDEKPSGAPGQDWRDVLYQQGKDAESLGLNSNYYYTALKNEWPKLYNSETLTWDEKSLKDPSSIDYFLDFIDTNTSLNRFNISNIGTRSQVISSNDINCLFAPSVSDLYIVDASGEIEVQSEGLPYVLVSSDTLKDFGVGFAYRDAFSTIRDMLYTNVSYATTINLQTMPIYYLDANQQVYISEEESGIHGGFMINSISLPLSITEQMSINASMVLERI